MCGDMGKAVLGALTGALLCGLVSDAAYLHRYDPYSQYEQAIVRPKPLREHEKPQDLRNVPGSPGIDFPVYHKVPETSFSCHNVPVAPGMYANVETGCQAYHICHDGREGEQGASFLCTNGTLFDQEKFACDWWYNVDCSKAVQLYRLNADPAHNPFLPKLKPEESEEETHHGHGYNQNHGHGHAQDRRHGQEPYYGHGQGQNYRHGQGQNYRHGQGQNYGHGHVQNHGQDLYYRDY